MADTDNPHADLVAALGALTEVPKAGKVSAGQRQYKFMTLPDLLGAVRPVFAAHNLAVSQQVLNHESGVTVITRILHITGHVFESPPLTLRCGPDPQAIGSAITYGRRYQLAALVGLAGDDDDDAQAATSSRRPQSSFAEAIDNAEIVRATVTRTPDSRPAPPPDHRGGQVTPGTASPQSIKYLWTLLHQTGMDEASIRGWVGEVLSIGVDWSTKQLSQAQVSQLIERLKREQAQGSDTTPEEDGG